MHNYYNLLLLIIFDLLLLLRALLCTALFSITVMYYIRNFININFYCENSCGGGGRNHFGGDFRR